jgi:two-component system OmpR family response regulator
MKHCATILAVDNDESTQTVLKEYLEREGYRVVCERYGKGFIDILNRTLPDLILLDVVLPDEDGISLINQIRARTASPIIVISKKKNTMDKVVGLEMGANDYVGKPYEIRELAARIKAHLRLVKNVEKEVIAAIQNEKAKIIHFGHWHLDLNRYELLDKNKEPLDITSGEIEMLKAFTASPHKVLTRNQLFDQTRGRDYEGYDRAVDVQISRLRQKLGDDKREKPFIKTIRGVGYMLDTDTTIIE